MKIGFIRALALLAFPALLPAQVYSPKLLRQGQPDSTDMEKFAQAIYIKAGAQTPRAKAEAIWRFFLTDGRFVEPGFWYHIAGWTYEEPTGEVLDPLKLINSYGFGLCYHIAPLLEAVFKAGGFADARTWFLTGHTVAEVFYDGHYHYYDSDMMGYNVAGEGHFFGKPVAGVRDLERDGNIILGKLRAPDRVNLEAVDTPWYPADVRERAMGDLAGLFTSTADNYLFVYNRYATGHRMDFVLRPGEKLIRYFQPEEPGLFYLPYRYDGKQWREFPREIAEYAIRTQDGPRSQKDARLWATGRIEYAPPLLSFSDQAVIEMPSPYVIIDAQFTLNLQLDSRSSIRVETSIDGGTAWDPAGFLNGPYRGAWKVEPKIVARSAHGRLTAVSGSYGYLVRITKQGESDAKIDSCRFVSRIQLNPRTLPSIGTGENGFDYTAAGPIQRIPKSASLSSAPARDLRLVTENGQAFLLPAAQKTGELLYDLQAGDSPITGFEVGTRFLNLRGHLAPDKLTAETRPTTVTTEDGETSISWSRSHEGPFHQIYKSPSKLEWLDGDPVDRLLLWPEVFQKVPDLPAGMKHVYVKIKSSGPAIDNIRLAVYAAAAQPSGKLEITQVWSEGGKRHEHIETVDAAAGERHFTVSAGPGARNESVTMYLVPRPENQDAIR